MMMFDFRGELTSIILANLLTAFSAGLISPFSHVLAMWIGAITTFIQPLFPPLEPANTYSGPRRPTTSSRRVRLRRISALDLISFSRDACAATVWPIVAVG